MPLPKGSFNLAVPPPAHYRVRALMVRILIDGYSFLHSCPQIAPRAARHSERARDELLYWMSQYRDAVGTPITVVFDGGRAPAHVPKTPSTPEMEILYSKSGQTADDLIERAAQRLLEYGEILVVTDDLVERTTIHSMGGLTASCGRFLQDMMNAIGDVARDLRAHNQRETRRFRRPHQA